ncbi:MAG: histone-like protein [Candidatus Micrarchaeia archaeon]
MRILSAELGKTVEGGNMASLSRGNIKKLIKKYTKANITDDGIDAVAKLLESKAMEISKFAVKNAKQKKREKITKEDIMEYVVRHG